MNMIGGIGQIVLLVFRFAFPLSSNKKWLKVMLVVWDTLLAIGFLGVTLFAAGAMTLQSFNTSNPYALWNMVCFINQIYLLGITLPMQIKMFASMCKCKKGSKEAEALEENKQADAVEYSDIFMNSPKERLVLREDIFEFTYTLCFK